MSSRFDANKRRKLLKRLPAAWPDEANKPKAWRVGYGKRLRQLFQTCQVRTWPTPQPHCQGPLSSSPSSCQSHFDSRRCPVSSPPRQARWPGGHRPRAGQQLGGPRGARRGHRRKAEEVAVVALPGRPTQGTRHGVFCGANGVPSKNQRSLESWSCCNVCPRNYRRPQHKKREKRKDKKT